MNAARAAWAMAQEGKKVHLLARGPSLGENPEGSILPSQGQFLPEFLAVSRHPNIEVLTLVEVIAVERYGDSYRVTIRRHPRYVEEKRCTACGRCEAVCPVYVPGHSQKKAIHLPYLKSIPSAYLVEKRGTSPCRAACPLHQRAQGYIALIKEGRYQDAFRVIKQDNPFPSICGRICNHRCEEECSRGRYDQPVSIMALKRFVADWVYTHGERTRTERVDPPLDAPRVAVVGAGPAGLTCAGDLAGMGYRVTVFEALPFAGGMMRVGIPRFRLALEPLQWEIDDILAKGVELRANHRVESVEALFEQGFKAIFLAVGAHLNKTLPIPGADLEAVYLGTDFLRSVNLGEKVRLGEKVLVLGGGNVAIDIARTALRLGPREVHLACLESREQMPAHVWEVEAAEAEGVIVHPGRSFREISHEDGWVTGVQCLEVTFMKFDEDGGLTLETRPGSEHTLSCDTVIFAIGQAPDLSLLPDGVQKTRRGTVAVDPDTLAASYPGLFAGGDAVTGTTFVADAIAAGHRAGDAIDRYLRGEALAGEPALMSKVELSSEEIEERIRSGFASPGERQSMPALSPSEAREDFREVQLGLTESQALAEAERCLSCGECSECLVCQTACELEAIDHSRRAEEMTIEAGAVIFADSEEMGQYPPVPFLGTVHPVSFGSDGQARIGVFVCRCGDNIAGTLDLDSLCEELRGLERVASVRQIPYACVAEGAEAILKAKEEDRLNRVVLAACSCCSLDQICYSCSYQRVRCKEELSDLGCPVELVNIREHCALLYRQQPQEAREVARDSIAAAVARARLPFAMAEVEAWRCRSCSICRDACRFEAIRMEGVNGRLVPHLDQGSCKACGVCAAYCPTGAIRAGFVSDREIEVTLEAMLSTSNIKKVIAFLCNWQAYSGAEMMGLQGLGYPLGLRLIRLQCLGRLQPGLILKGLELGAAGVLLLGCPPEECQHQVGHEAVQGVFEVARALAKQLGLKGRVGLDWVPIGDADLLAKKVEGFVRKVSRA